MLDIAIKLWLAVVVVLVCTELSFAQQASASSAADFGGPSSVRAQIRTDEAAGKAPGRVLPSIPARAWLERELGLTLGADYNVLLQHASTSPGEKDATAGVARLYGEWKPFNRNAADASALVFKLENRHRLGTAIAPGQLGPEIGYAGVTGVGFSAAGSLLTNLYWYQRFPENRFAFAAGIVDVTDYVDVYGLVNSRTDGMMECRKRCLHN
jgi:porin